MCTVTRVDAAAANTSWAQNLGQLTEGATNVYIFWTAVNLALYNNALHNSEIWVRPLNKTTLALGTATRLDTDNVVGVVDSAWDWDGVGSVRLTSGVLIAAYGTAGTAPSTHARESGADDPTTWGSRATVDSSGANRCLTGIGTDGTNVWIHTQDQNSGDLYLWTRTSANTWAAATTALGSGKIHDAAGANTSPFFYGIVSNRLTSMRNMVVASATKGCIVLGYSSASSVQDQVRCLYTTDSWATTSQSVVKDYSGSANTIAAGSYPKIILGTDNRIRCFWIENNATYGYVPVLAYSDNYGQTWTVIGTPFDFTGKGTWDNDYDGAFALDTSNRMYCSMFDSSNGSNIKHRMFKGGDSLSGWVETTCENLSQNIAGATGSDGFISSSGAFIRVFNGVSSSGGSHNEVNFLAEANVVTSAGGAPPTVVESPSGTDQPDLYLRLDIADDKGWSAHQVQVTCFFEWPEGDYTTERRKPEVMALVSSLDANVQDPAILPALWKIDDQERWGKEALVENADGSFTYIDDPMLFKWWSAEMNLGEEGSTNLVRGIYFKYRREGHVGFDVETWVDGEKADTQTVTPSWPEPREFWWPIPRDTNSGSRVQLRVEDREPADLVIESYAVKFKPKHWRMRNP